MKKKTNPKVELSLWGAEGGAVFFSTITRVPSTFELLFCFKLNPNLFGNLF